MLDSGGTMIPETHIEYAWPHMRPLLFTEAAALTAQWHAELTSHVRPACMSSKAPRLSSTGASSARRTDDVVRPELAKLVVNS